MAGQVGARVGILGAGAVGGMLAVLLAEAGHEVTVLASERTSTAINVGGIALRSQKFGDRRAHVPARPYLTAPVDVLFVAVKAPDLLAALGRVPAALLSDTAVAPLLNGTDHVALLRAALPRTAVVPMTVSVEATRTAPGDIEHLSPFLEYALAEERERARVDPEDLLRTTGLDVDASAPDEATLLWRKLSFLAPLALLTTHARQPVGPARDAHPDLLDGLVTETAAAAATAGAEIDPAAVAKRIAGLPAGMRSSMLKDAIAGATLELDAIAGPILRALPDGAPVTRAVVAEIAEAR
ncbi:2-dehydropantoate 2-reductase [Pseudonocardia hierapolitana]|uniref:2-dehydropantoate 2-reductase n=1 Tax=Pseudonocardia hierapolitana TaxID=1128676 RepID=A0A561T486_9PSEU|nr:2-dehydropantoate 2-reductase N-terminal domain-containing protein [Pseudonocardia hierapolitana]TWF81909.1 2-dehydropantoate 2-reductase [Pseudonocardia hierapolitana]